MSDNSPSNLNLPAHFEIKRKNKNIAFKKRFHVDADEGYCDQLFNFSVGIFDGFEICVAMMITLF